jgi:hypothetical protein
VKKDRSFPIKPRALSDDELTQIVAAALRQDFGDMVSAVKRIGQLTNTNLRAIKNWYEARNTPSSGHLLLLARSSPSILKFIMEQIGGEDLWDAFHLLSYHAPTSTQGPEKADFKAKITYKNVRINVPRKSLNARQRWFLILLHHKNTASAEDIVGHFGVAIKTAERDLVSLKEVGKIRFVGSKRTGSYEIIENSL